MENIEFEALYPNVVIADVQVALQAAGATCTVPRRMMRRQVMFPPQNPNRVVPHLWVRVRDEGDKITASVKGHDGTDSITAQTEVSITVDSFEQAVAFAEAIGCTKKTFQENYRETWDLDGAEIVIDEWPYLEPYIEIEADSEEKVQQVSATLGFDYANALFTNVIELYHRKYGLPHKQIVGREELVFDQPNPFI